MIQPLNGFAVGEEIKDEKKTSSGIYVSTKEESEYIKAKVLNIADNGQGIKKGDTVLLDTYQVVNVDESVVFKVDNILAIIKDANTT